MLLVEVSAFQIPVYISEEQIGNHPLKINITISARWDTKNAGIIKNAELTSYAGIFQFKIIRYPGYNLR